MKKICSRVFLKLGTGITLFCIPALALAITPKAAGKKAVQKESKPQAPGPIGFSVNLKSLAKSNSAFLIGDATQAQINAKGPVTQMKAHEIKSEWKECAGLREAALKAHGELAGWIWSMAFNCEIKLFESVVLIQNSKTSAKTKTESKIDRIKKIAQNFDGAKNHHDLLDRGPWKKDLQTQWLKTLGILKNQAQTQAEKNQAAEFYFQRPELLSSDLQRELLGYFQEPFPATSGFSTPNLRTATVVAEPWWEAARRMDYEQVIKLLEAYFDKNESPSNILSSRLILAKAYLWTGRYDQAKTTFQKLADEFPLTEEGVDAQFRLGLLHLRLGNPKMALEAFDKLLATSREKNPLTTRYWRLRCLQELGQTEAFEAERGLIVNQYPFTYFGIKLRVEAQQGRLEFPQVEVPVARAQFHFPKSAQNSWKRFLTLVRLGLLWEASTEIQEILAVGDAEAFQMWAEFFAEIKLDSLAIRFGQSAQNQDSRLMAWSFQQKLMPFSYDKVVKDQALLQKIDPWIIWAVIRQESAFNIRATSTSNAYGLMQLIGPTAQEVAQDLRTQITVPDDLFVPEKNIPFGAKYLSKMKNDFGGHWPLAVAAYNAGPTRLKSWLKLRKDTENLTQVKSTEWRDEIWIDEMPWVETQNYVKSVMRNFILYRLGNNSNWTLPPVFWSESDSGKGVSGSRVIEKKSIKR